MTTNILTFQKEYLIPFLMYQREKNTKLYKYYISFLKFNTISPPPNYKIEKTSKLEKNQIVIELPKELGSKYYVSFENQKNFENIVFESFKVICITDLFVNHYNNFIDERINFLLQEYKIDSKYFEMIKKMYYRVRNDCKTSRK